MAYWEKKSVSILTKRNDFLSSNIQKLTKSLQRTPFEKILDPHQNVQHAVLKYIRDTATNTTVKFAIDYGATGSEVRVEATYLPWLVIYFVFYINPKQYKCYFQVIFCYVFGKGQSILILFFAVEHIFRDRLSPFFSHNFFLRSAVLARYFVSAHVRDRKYVSDKVFFTNQVFFNFTWVTKFFVFYKIKEHFYRLTFCYLFTLLRWFR